MTTTHSSKQKAVFEEELFPALLKLIVEVDSTKRSGRRVGYTHQPSPTMVLFCSQRLQQLALMLLRISAKQILDFVYIKDCESSILAFVSLAIEKANGDLLCWEILVTRSLEVVLETYLDLGQNRRAGANGGCRLRNGPGAHGAHCTKLPRVETAGVEIAQRLQHIDDRIGKIGLGKGIALALSFWCADNHPAGLFGRLQAVTV